MYCEKCQTEISDGNSICFNCNLFQSFIGEKKSAFYLSKWSSDKKVSWNWPAFLFTWFWLGYRKIYTHIFLLLGIFIIIDILSYYLGDLDNVIGIILGFVYGLLGNYFYRLHAEKKINKIKGKYTTESQLLEEARKQGGASVAGVWISVGLLVAYVVITMFIYSFLDRL